MNNSSEVGLLVVFGRESFFRSLWPFHLWSFFSPLSGISQIRIQDAIDSLDSGKFDFVYVSLNEMCSNLEESLAAENHVFAMVPDDLKDKVFISANHKKFFTDELTQFIAEKMSRKIVSLHVAITEKAAYLILKERIKNAIDIFSKNNSAITLVRISQHT